MWKETGGTASSNRCNTFFRPPKKQTRRSATFRLFGGGGEKAEGDGTRFLQEAGGREEGMLRREGESADEERIVRCVVLTYADVC